MNRIEEIDKEIEILEKILEDKESNWDFTKEPIDIWYKQYLEYTKPESKKINELYREKRMIQPYTLSELSDFGDVMTLNDFIECVKEGGFIDYDGYGLYIKDNQQTNIEIYPSDIKYNSIRKEFDKIIWFNR